MSDREKVIKGLETIKQFFGYGLPSVAEMFDSYYGTLNDAIVLLKEQNDCENCAIAIEDRQPVVRCKDCRHGVQLDDSDYYVCGKPFASNRETHTAEWFCADGTKEFRRDQP